MIRPAPSPTLDLSQRGYRPAYHGACTPCPGCHLSQWHVGRKSAECHFCGTALALPSNGQANLEIVNDR